MNGFVIDYETINIRINLTGALNETTIVTLEGGRLNGSCKSIYRCSSHSYFLSG
jgi:hypothetical protein